MKKIFFSNPRFPISAPSQQPTVPPSPLPQLKQHYPISNANQRIIKIHQNTQQHLSCSTPRQGCIVMTKNLSIFHKHSSSTPHLNNLKTTTPPPYTTHPTFNEEPQIAKPSNFLGENSLEEFKINSKTHSFHPNLSSQI